MKFFRNNRWEQREDRFDDVLVAQDANAKGDIFVATADDLVARLAVGNAGETLIPDSGESAGVKWSDHHVKKSEWLQNGFVDATDVDLSWDDGNRRVTVAPAVASYSFYQAGVLYTKTGSDTVDLADTEGLWAIYFDGGTLTALNSPTHAQIDSVIENAVVVAYVYWDATNNDGRLMWELHGYRMSPATHHWIHDHVGAVYQDGMALDDFSVDGTGNDNAHAQFSVAEGEFYDEDVEVELAEVLSTAGLEIWYLDGADWRWTTNAGYSVVDDGSDLYWNNAGAQEAVDSNDFVLCHVFATNIVADDGTTPKFIAIQGQAEYNTRGQARAGADEEINALVYGALPLQEIVPVATVIFQNKGSTGHGAIRTNEAGDNWTDWRSSNLKASGGMISDHGSLAGLGDNDHAGVYPTQPASAVDNSIPRFDGDENTLQNSGVTVDDSDFLLIPAHSTANRMLYTSNASGKISQTTFEEGDVLEDNRFTGLGQIHHVGANAYIERYIQSTDGSVQITNALGLTGNPDLSVDLDRINISRFHGTKSLSTDNCGGANGTTQTIRWDVEAEKDTGFTHSTSTNSERITVSTTGRYQVLATVSCQQGGSARTTLRADIIVNGSTAYPQCSARNYSRGSSYGDLSMNIATEIDLTAGQYIEIQTTVDDTDGVYTLNTIAAQCQIIMTKLE